MENALTPKERIKNLILPKKITPQLAYFCGVLAGDGNIGFREKKKEYCIKCVGNPADEIKYYKEIIKPLIKNLFNLEIEPKFHDKKTTYGFSLYSKSVVKYLTETIGLPLGKKYDKLSIPKMFLKNKVLVRNFICGVADTDFHLRIRKGYYPVICGASKSKSFMEEIKHCLEKESFRVYMYERRDNDKRVKKIVVTHRIEIYGQKQFSMWMEKIGFKHPKNKEKIAFLSQKTAKQ